MWLCVLALLGSAALLRLVGLGLLLDWLGVAWLSSLGTVERVCLVFALEEVITLLRNFGNDNVCESPIPQTWFRSTWSLTSAGRGDVQADSLTRSAQVFFVMRLIAEVEKKIVEKRVAPGMIRPPDNGNAPPPTRC